jgi:nucleoporin POM152
MMRSEKFEFLDLRKNREKLTLQIPREIQSEGGSFEVYLVSVQDAQGCKRSLNIPGLTVHVPQVKVGLRALISVQIVNLYSR